MTALLRWYFGLIAKVFAEIKSGIQIIDQRSSPLDKMKAQLIKKV